MAPPAAPVVDARFRSTHATAFTLTKTPLQNFTVTDAGDTAVMRVDASKFLLLPRHYLFRDAASRRPGRAHRGAHTHPFGIRRTWEVFRGDSTSQTDLLFVAIAQPSFFKAADVHVHLAGGGDTTERHPDFVVVRHGYHGCENTVSRGGGAVVAQIDRIGPFRFLGYNVSINAGVDQAFILALTVILEAISLDNVLTRRH